MTRIHIPLAVFLLLSITGCASIGPGTVTRDRFDYVTAISIGYARFPGGQTS